MAKGKKILLVAVFFSVFFFLVFFWHLIDFYFFCSIILINPLSTRNPKIGTLANSKDPDEMLHYAAFHLGLHCLLRLNKINNII